MVGFLAFCLIILSQVACFAAGSEFAGLMRRADILVKEHQIKQSLPLYRKAVRLNPSSAKAHAGLGWALFNTGQKQQGLKEVQRAVSLSPRSAQAHHYLAMIYMHSGQMQEAADELRKEYAIAPKRKCNCGAVKYILQKYPPHKQ